MKRKALIVEDVAMNREMLREMIEDEFEILEAENGIEALEHIDRYGEDISVILLDLVMPVMDGFGVLKGINERKLIGRIPVLVISAESSDAEHRCFEYGVTDFIRKPFDERIVRRRVKNNSDLNIYKNRLEEIVKAQTEELLAKNRDLQEQTERLEKINENIIEILGTVVEARNLESGQHIRRVKKYSKIIGENIMKNHPEYGLTQDQVNLMVSASPLHDLGKIKIPDAILLKPGKLDPDEWEIMKTHSAEGSNLIETISEIWSEEYRKMCWEIARWHHERYDGRGYPDGLEGNEIPIASQIVALADVYDALVNDRPYKKAFSKEKAYEMITNGECGTFSEDIMKCFAEVRDKMEECANG